MIGDPFLNYFALGLLIFVVVVVFYGTASSRSTTFRPKSQKDAIILTQMRSMRQAG